MEKLGILEGILFVVGSEGISITELEEILDIKEENINFLIEKLKERYNSLEYGLNLEFLGGKYKLTTKKEHNDYYIKLLDKETSDYVVGAVLVLKDNNDKVIDEWKTTDSAHKVVKLEKGTYILEQKSTVDGYEANDTSLVFKITGEDKSIVMYNKAKVEEVKESETEINVDNTLSNRSVFSIVFAISVLLVGVKMVLFPNERLIIKER